MPLIADIAVNAPLKQLFSYRVPASFSPYLQPGMRVSAPFGRRRTVGLVMILRQGPGEDLKELSEVLDEFPLLPGDLLHLLRWAAEYYCHPLGQVVRTALPAGLGSDRNRPQVMTEPVYRLPSSGLPDSVRGSRQRELLDFIAAQGAAGLSQLRQRFPAPHAVLKTLVAKEWLCVTEEERLRDPFLGLPVAADTPPALTAAQQCAVAALEQEIRSGQSGGFLLHGVTGSGKTEVYLRAVACCLARQRQALVLVPEISLTPQLVGRFRARFESSGVRIAVLHSGLSAGERYDAWREIARGRIAIVIGARSAIFAPLHRPGLIIVDEEHDGSYKQGEGFRYHARDLALVRGRRQHCPVLLGSATPALTTYHRCRQGALGYLTLDRRIHQGALPTVELIDRRGSAAAEILSGRLLESLQQTLEERGQALLLLNRRGFAPFLLCQDCGAGFFCPNCNISLTYHQHVRELRCHYCDFHRSIPEACPGCRGPRIEPQGVGTERLEQFLQEQFPGARIARMDRDAMRRKGAAQRLSADMLERRIDILVGTQMIAKGHDFPGVALVGVLGADSLLNFPDFRAAERGFGLLTQVAGRAGRTGGGRVFIETHNPEHYALSCAAEHDFKTFYEQERAFREELGYPPLGYLANLVLADNDRARVARAAEQLAGDARRCAGAVEVLGPSPCPLMKLRGKNRYQILLKSAERPPLRHLLQALDNGIAGLPRQVAVAIDVDPLDMM